MKKIIFLIALISLCGCSSTVKERMSYNDLNQFKVDCKQRDAQLSFLKSQRVSSGDKIISAFTFAGSTSKAGYEQNRNIVEGRYNWVLDSLVTDLKRCPTYNYPDPKKDYAIKLGLKWNAQQGHYEK